MRDTLLHELLSQPTAPFRETHVIRFLTQTLRDHGVPHFQDSVGNLILGAENERDYRHLMNEKTDEPLRLFIAHMDHPGFHGAKWETGPGDSRALDIQWHGGSPYAHIEGSKVWLADDLGLLGYGLFTRSELHPSGRAISSGRIELTERLREIDSIDPATVFGGFGFRAPVWREGDVIYTKAADDLIGCFALLTLAIELYGSDPSKARSGKSKKKKALPKKRPPFLGLLTRAEEVGFIGAIGHLELGWWKKARRPLLGVSLETSRTLPGAEFGKGPVVRLGDRFTVFDPGALRVFTELAAEALPGRHQRRIMDGGSCEASAATVYGIPCIGISVPLGNYHNQDLQGGPDARGQDGPAPEFVYASDVEGLIALCRALLKPKLPWKAPFAAKLKNFRSELRRYKPLLRG
jgi:putative aminopeptidase FrvX